MRASYNGDYWIKSVNRNEYKVIHGKIPTFLKILKSPVKIQVGYNVSYEMQLNISGVSDLTDYSILFSAYYDDDSEGFLLKNLKTDQFGKCNYTISDIMNNKWNLRIYFEYLGTDVIAYNYTFEERTITQKWNTTIYFQDLKYTPRFGQIIPININFSCVEDPLLSYEGLGVSFMFKYGTTIPSSVKKYIDAVNQINFYYKIADLFEGNLIISIIFEGTDKITSISMNKSLEINPKLHTQIELSTEAIPSQLYIGEFSFSVRLMDYQSNPLAGYILLFQIIDETGRVLYNTTSVTNEDGIASVTVEFTQVGDNYKVKIVFFEEGIYLGEEVFSSNIRVVDAFILFIDMLPYILIGLAILFGSILTIYRGIVIPKRNRYRKMLKQMYQKLSDVENIQYFLILTKDGLPVFSKSFADVPIDESLISGFLSAISSFGTEIGHKMKAEGEGGLEELSYRQFKIILNEKDFVRTAILLLKRPSEQLKYKLKIFTEQIEEQHKEELIDFKGEMFEEAPVMKLIENIFEADLLYPHHLLETKLTHYLKNLSKKDIKKNVLIIAKGEEFESVFYLRDMINHLRTMGIDEIKTFEGLQKLRDEKIVFAINPRTNYLIEQFQPIIKQLDIDDVNVLFAIFDKVDNINDIQRYLKKRSINIKKGIVDCLTKLISLKLISQENLVTEVGEIVATLSKLIPKLIPDSKVISESEMVSIPKKELEDNINSIKVKIKKLKKENKLIEVIQLLPQLLELYKKKGDLKKVDQIITEHNELPKIILQSKRKELIKQANKAIKEKDWQKAAEIFGECKEISSKLFTEGNMSELDNVKIFTAKQQQYLNKINK